MDIKLQVDDVTVEPTYTKNARLRPMVEVSLSGVTWSDLLDQVGIDEFVAQAETDDLLECIGVDDAMLHFNLKSRED